MLKCQLLCGKLFPAMLSKSRYKFQFLVFILRMIEIGAKSFPEIFHTKGLAQEVCSLELVTCLLNEYLCSVNGLWKVFSS